jgi:CDP-diacylglycerol--serine O-phosphatidyltransferase
MKTIKRYIPSLLTLINLALGVMAVLVNDPVKSLIFILIACVFDVFDGIVARWLKATSDFGKELDSLADMVTFGVAPALLVYFNCLPSTLYFQLAIILLPVFSAIRLAKFNMDVTQKSNFSGLPTPANGLFFASLPYLYQSGYVLKDNQLVILIVIFSLMMISSWRMFSFKNIGRGGMDTYIPLIFLILVLPAAFLLHYLVIPVGVILYILMSGIYHFLYKFKKG